MDGSAGKVGEEFSICSADFFWRNSGGQYKLPKDSFTKLFKLCIIVVSRDYAIYYILYTIILNNNESNVK